ncbi:MAG: glutaredoxin [Nanoarchaeota archaeon]|nr:glutaredoxin [Nanoarchaeota archaeon]|tara:strand:- start:148 stop:381 length:234 start_codon:yes stop_codon:yes gene_type:complete
MTKRLVMFVLEGCPYCKKAEKALKAKGVKYEEIEVPPNKSDRTLLKQISGQDSVPVLLDVIGSKDQDDDIIEWLETQ